MFGRVLLAVGLLAVALFAAVALTRKGPAQGERAKGFVRDARFTALAALDVPKTPPGPGDWLAQHPEAPESYLQWRDSNPVRVTTTRRAIYLQPFGGLTAAQEQVVALTADYVGRYFGVEVKARPPLPASLLPPQARRKNPVQGQPQLLTGAVMEVLAQRRPEDAVAYIALTGEDLFPDPDWNFVFGAASLTERVGVWSLYRFGDPGASPEAFEHTLVRTIATAIHELGHMFSIPHCVERECIMNGANHEQEAASRPLEPCSEDLAKLCDATGCDLIRRYDALISFWQTRSSGDVTLARLRRARALLGP